MIFAKLRMILATCCKVNPMSKIIPDTNFISGYNQSTAVVFLLLVLFLVWLNSNGKLKNIIAIILTPSTKQPTKKDGNIVDNFITGFNIGGSGVIPYIPHNTKTYPY